MYFFTYSFHILWQTSMKQKLQTYTPALRRAESALCFSRSGGSLPAVFNRPATGELVSHACPPVVCLSDSQPSTAIAPSTWDSEFIER